MTGRRLLNSGAKLLSRSVRRLPGWQRARWDAEVILGDAGLTFGREEHLAGNLGLGLDPKPSGERAQGG